MYLNVLKSKYINIIWKMYSGHLSNDDEKVQYNGREWYLKTEG